MTTFVRKGALKPVSSNSIKVSELKAEDVVVIGRFDSIEEVTNPKDGKKFEVLHFTDLEDKFFTKSGRSRQTERDFVSGLISPPFG